MRESVSGIKHPAFRDALARGAELRHLFAAPVGAAPWVAPTGHEAHVGVTPQVAASGQE